MPIYGLIYREIGFLLSDYMDVVGFNIFRLLSQKAVNSKSPGSDYFLMFHTATFSAWNLS